MNARVVAAPKRAKRIIRIFILPTCVHWTARRCGRLVHQIHVAVRTAGKPLSILRFTLGAGKAWSTMYCPRCKAEYRQGFTRCSDCDVDLVNEPPASASGPVEASGQDENPDDPFCSFWRGDDPRIHAELCELLNEEGIAHKTIRREDHLFNLNTKSAFEIGIPFSLFEKAEAAIKAAYGTEGEQQDAARLLPSGGRYTEELPGGFPWHPFAKGLARAAIDGEEERLSEM